MQNRIRRILKNISFMLNIRLPKIIFIKDNISFYSEGVIHISIVDDFNKMLFLALHELRHHYQYLYMKNNINNLSKIISYEMNNEIDYMNSFIEGDAYTFSLYVFDEILHIPYQISLEVKEIIDNFNKNYIFNLFYINREKMV